MKRVLIITDLIQSSPRFPGISDYLRDFGWDATIVTPPLDQKESIQLSKHRLSGTSIVETTCYKRKRDLLHNIAASLSNKRELRSPIWKIGRSVYHRIRRIYELIVDQIYWFPDSDKHWVIPAVTACQKLIEKERFDALLSSSSPVTSHLVASILQERTGLPWMADFRDLWTQNHVYRFSRIRRLIERRLEIATLKGATTMLTVTPTFVEDLTRLHRGTPVAELRNGFDPRWYQELRTRVIDKFTITYTGRIYAGKQNPSLVLCALSDLISEGAIPEELVCLRFYGPLEISIDWEAESLGIGHIVDQYGMISRSAVAERQRESQLLLLFNWEDKRARGGIIMQKTFDYIGARRPILATGGHRGDLREDMLSQGRFGLYCPELMDVKNALRKWFSQYQELGYVPFKGCESFVEECSYPRRAKQLSHDLDLIAGAAPP